MATFCYFRKMNEKEKIARAKAFEQLDKIYEELRTFRRLLAESNVTGLEIVGIEKKVNDLIYSLTYYHDENLES